MSQIIPEGRRVALFPGDCLESLRKMPDSSVDSIVTDSPYGLSFMGRKWDYDVPSVEIWAECLRVLKPGGHLLAFAGTRTQHRMACRIEDAGFEIRDMIGWMYGSGFNKVGYIRGADGEHVIPGFGGSLKPAFEPITMARKPLIGTIAENVLAHGTGALNIDGCRVGTSKDVPGAVKTGRPIMADSWLRKHGYGSGFGPREMDQSGMNPNIGRWPANLILQDCDEVVAAFPQANSKTGGPARTSIGGKGTYSGGDARVPVGYDDTGSAARFFQQVKRDAEDVATAQRLFYCAKASRKDRGEGNNHPTVKPTELMRYLCRLVTPPSGVVLDPFMGSGSTGKAAMLEGFKFIGCELSPEYLEIAKARIRHAMQQSEQADPADDSARPEREAATA